MLFLLPVVAGAAVLSEVEGRPNAPAINLLRLSGERFSLEENRGKVVLVNFWATWCPPCLKELPSMQDLWKKYRNRDFVMVGVNVGEDDEEVFRFTGSFDTELDFPLLLDQDLKVVKTWPVFGLPTTFVIDKRGRIVYRAKGERDWMDSEIQTTLERLMMAQ